MKTVHIIGMGLIGQERARAVSCLKGRGLPIRFGKVSDPFCKQMADLEGKFGFEGVASADLILKAAPDANSLVIIATPHDIGTGYAIAALEAGHRVLLEKPMGRNQLEAARIASAVRFPGQLTIGFNYRFMPGIQALLRDVAARRFGNLISVTLHMGHGGSPQDKEGWKLDPVRCGGGALLDPGVHLLDLAQAILAASAGSGTSNGDRARIQVRGAAQWKGFWATGIEEEVNAVLSGGVAPGHVSCSLQVSVVRWRSSFELRVLGDEGYGIVTGRGRSYGPQTYVRGPRWGWQKASSQTASEEHVVSGSDCADSFADETAACLGLADPAPLREDFVNESLEVMRLHDEIMAATATPI